MSRLKLAFFPTRGGVLPYILDDIRLALEKLGHQTIYFPVKVPEYGFDLKISLDFCQSYKPDYVIMIGKNGIITPDGYTSHFFEQEKIPYISLNFDFPYSLLANGPEQNAYLKAITLWDQYYVSLFQQHGFKNVYYLPLATSLDRFKPQNIAKNIDISFIGLVEDEKQLNNQLMSLPAESKQICETAIKQYLHTSRPLLDIVKETFRNICKIDQPFLHSDFARIYYIAESKLNTILRKQTITRLTSKYPIQIFGNKSWESISSHNSNINPTVSYNDIGTIYATSKINLNITAPQLVNTINQRIFDIGAMGEFVITDYRSSLTEYFNDDEIVVYKDKSGLMELTDYYLKNDQARAEKSRKLHDAVIARHTWDIRVKKLIGIINNERKI